METSSTQIDLPPFPSFPCVSRYVPLGSVEETLVRERKLRRRITHLFILVLLTVIIGTYAYQRRRTVDRGNAASYVVMYEMAISEARRYRSLL